MSKTHTKLEQRVVRCFCTRIRRHARLILLTPDLLDGLELSTARRSCVQAVDRAWNHIQAKNLVRDAVAAARRVKRRRSPRAWYRAMNRALRAQCGHTLASLKEEVAWISRSHVLTALHHPDLFGTGVIWKYPAKPITDWTRTTHQTVIAHIRKETPLLRELVAPACGLDPRSEEVSHAIRFSADQVVTEAKARGWVQAMVAANRLVDRKRLQVGPVRKRLLNEVFIRRTGMDEETLNQELLALRLRFSADHLLRDRGLFVSRITRRADGLPLGMIVHQLPDPAATVVVH